MALQLDDVRAFGHALPAPFLKLKLETELLRHKLLRKSSSTDAQKLAADWDFYRNKLRALGQGLSERVKNHVLEPLVAMLGYEEIVAADEVVTREGKENGGLLFRGKDGASLRAWAVARDTDLDAPSKRGRAYRFSPARIAHRVLEQTGEHLGLLTDGTELRLLLRDPGRADSHLVLPLERDGGWRSAREAPDSFRLLLALGSPKGVQAIPQLIDAARGAQREVTKKLRQQARAAVEKFVQGVYDNPKNAEQRAAWQQLDSDARAKLAKELWREGLILVYRLLFVLKLESDADPARVFSFAATSLWRQTFSPSTGLAPIVRRVLDDGADTGGLLEGGLRSLFRLFVEGLVSRELTVRPLGGALFGPEAMPRLEALRWGERAVSHLLDALLWTPADGKIERERVHYGTLDVEDLGSVYEALLELEPGIATEPMCRLRRAKLEVVVPAAQGDPYRAAAGAVADEDAEDDDADEADEDGDEDKKGKGKTKVAFVEDIPAGRFFLRTGLGRKSSGSYYTPQAFVRFLVEETLGPQLRVRSPKDDPKPAAILALKVLDPAMGSGHFLVEACRHLGSALYEACRLCDELATKAETDAAKAGPTEREALLARTAELRSRVQVLPDPQDELVAYLPSRASEGGDTGLSQRKAEALCRRLVAVHCLYGVDLNPLAVELARLSLWLESYAEGLPLTFLDHRLLQGNSLTGPFFKDLLTWPVSGQPIADLMFRGLAQSLEHRRAEAARLVGELEASVGRDLVDLIQKQQLKERLDHLLSPFCDLARAWSGIVMLGDTMADQAFRELAQAVSEGRPTAPCLLANPVLAQAAEAGASSISYDLAFPDVFCKPSSGFDAVLGNPPWDKVRTERRDLLATIDARFLGGKEAAGVGTAHEELEQAFAANPVCTRHEQDQKRLRRTYLRLADSVTGDRATLGNSADPDLYKFFVIRTHQQLAPTGGLGLVVGGGFAKVPTDGNLRKWLFSTCAVHIFAHFLNLRQLFGGASSRIAFVVLRASKDQRSSRTKLLIGLNATSPEDLLYPSEDRPLRYVDYDDATRSLTSTGDLTQSIQASSEEPQIANAAMALSAMAQLGIQPTADIHRTSGQVAMCNLSSVSGMEGRRDARDPSLSSQLQLLGFAPLYSGRSMTSHDSLPQGKSGKWDPRVTELVRLDHAKCQSLLDRIRYYRFSWRATCGHVSTNERSARACILPPGSVAGDSLRTERSPSTRPNWAALCVSAVFNSFVFDWLARRTIQSNLNPSVLKLIPWPDVTHCRSFLAHNAMRLECNNALYQQLWREQVGPEWREDSPENHLPAVSDPRQRASIRAQIDAVVATCYGLSRSQYSYVLSTFSPRTHPDVLRTCMEAVDDLHAIGMETFTRRYDPYCDIPIHEALPQPAVARHAFSPLPEGIASSRGMKRKPRPSSGPMLPFVEPPPIRTIQVAEPRPGYLGADHSTMLLSLLDERGSITSSDAQVATGLDAAGVRPLLQRLVADGHAKVEGQKRGTRYVRRTDG